MAGLPMMPTAEGAPGDGNLVAIHGGGSTEVFGGIIHLCQVVEMTPPGGSSFTMPAARIREPILANGVTIWIRGSLHLNLLGEPTVTDYADMLTRWTTIRDKMLLSNFELFVYYRTASPATYRKYKTVNAAVIRAFWDNPVGMSYAFAGVTTDKTLYATAPGL
jgi:hypothetical protein